MIVPRPTGSEVFGATPKMRDLRPLSLTIKAAMSTQQRMLDLQEIQGWFQRGEMLGGLWLPDWAYQAQDSAGTAVTAAGQVAVIWRDAAWGGQLGYELTANGQFNNGATGWNTGGTGVSFTVANGDGTLYRGSSTAYVNCTVSTVPGKLYRLEIYISGGTGVARPRVDNISLVGNLNPGLNSRYFIAANVSTLAGITIADNEGSTVIIDYVSIKEVFGNHGAQTTTANKPLTAITSQTQLPWLNADSTDVLPVMFPSALGSACTIARATPTGVEFADSQTVNATWNDLVRPNQYNSAVLIANRAPTAYEKVVISRVLGRYVPVLGNNRVTNGSFDTGDLAGWTVLNNNETNTVTYSNGGAVFTADGSTTLSLSQQNILKSGGLYHILFDYTHISGAGLKLEIPSATNTPIPAVTGAYNYVVYSDRVNFLIYRKTPGQATVGGLDNISVREIL